jgi:adenylate cyclase
VETWLCRACEGANPEGTRFCGHCGTRRDEPQSADRDERRLVTALFADISGFTTLADRLDEESLHAVIEPVIAGLAGIAERYEGFIAKYAGDALLVFFGAPVAHEDDAARALHVAWEMHRALPRLVEDLPEEARGLELHIGVNSGRVIAGQFGGDLRSDYSILGDAVNVAQRLESVAPSGETYVGRTTWELTRDLFELEWVGDLTVKGKPEPVAAWRLAGSKRSAATIDVGALGSGFIGRDAEIAAIDEVLGGLAAGRGGVVVVNGQPGVGKSRLTDEIRTRIDENVWWMEGRCVSYGADLAYWPYIDLLRRSFGIRIEDDPVLSAKALAAGLALASVNEVVPYFARLLGLPSPAGHDDLADLEPEAFHRGLHQSFEAWIRALAKLRPVVVAIEDVHWVDTASTELTQQLRRLCGDLPVAFYLTSRPQDGAVVERLVAGGEVPSAWIELRAFRPSDAARMVEAMLEAPPPTELVDAVVERTAGNPFFVREMVRSLVETGTLVRGDGEWVLDESWDVGLVPATIEGVLSARVDLLPRTTADVLQIASVIGRRVDTALLRLVAEDIPDVTGAIERLVASGFFDHRLVEGRDVLTFHHALVVDVAYNRLVGRQRRDLHRRVAEAAEVVYGSGDDVIDLLAREYYLADAGAKAVEYLQRAGERAKRLYANDEAELHLSRAIDVARKTPRVTSRLPSLLLQLGDVEELTGRYDEALDVFTEVRDLTSDAAAWCGIATILRFRGRYDESLAVIEEGLAEHAGDSLAVAHLELERGWTLYQAGRQAESIATLRYGLSLVEHLDHRVVGDLLLILARSEENEGEFEDALAHALDAQRRFDAMRDMRGLTKSLRAAGGVLFRMERHAEAAETLRRGLAIAERIGNVEELSACLVNLALAEDALGNVTTAVECDRRAITELERIGHSPGRAIALVNLATHLVELGSFDEALDHCREGLVLAREIGYRTTEGEALDTIATIHLKCDRFADAIEAAEAAASIFESMGAEHLAERARTTASTAAKARNSVATA